MGSWTLTATLAPLGNDLNSTSGFGNGLWIYDKYAAIGAPGCKCFLYLLSFYLCCNTAVLLLSTANNETGAAYVYNVNSTGGWSLNQRLVCSFSSPTVAPSTRQPRRPSAKPSSSSSSSSPVSAPSIYSASCSSSAGFGFKVGIYQNSSANSFLIVGAPNYCKYLAICRDGPNVI